MAKLFANSGDPDQTPRSAASDLGLHCLPNTLLRVSRLQWVKHCYSNRFTMEFKAIEAPHESIKRLKYSYLEAYQRFSCLFFCMEFNVPVNKVLYAVNQ